MAVVAVLETNALSMAVTSMKPKIIRIGCVPTKLNVISAIR